MCIRDRFGTSFSASAKPKPASQAKPSSPVIAIEPLKPASAQRLRAPTSSSSQAAASV